MNRLHCEFCTRMDSPATPVKPDRTMGFTCCTNAHDCSRRQRNQVGRTWLSEGRRTLNGR